MNNAYEQTKQILIEQAGDRVYSPGDSYASMWGKIVENEGLKLDALSRVSLMTTWKAWLNHLGGSASALESPNRVLGKILTALGGTPSVMELEGSLIRKIREAMGNGPGPDPSFVPITATGGTVEDVEIEGISYRVHTFTTSGDFVVSDTGSEGLVDALIAGGGGGGGNATTLSIRSSGGGGAGGSSIFSSLLVSLGIYPVVVGADSAPASQGNNSEFADLVATGGGHGGAGHIAAGDVATSGGSGGGGGDSSNASYWAYGEGIEGQGHRGGQGVNDPNGAGGGGGAGGVGEDGGGVSPAQGGPPFVSSFDGTSREYARGGSTQSRDQERDGDDGVNYGDGGQGASGSAAASGGKGRQGVIKIRYPLEAAS